MAELKQLNAALGSYDAQFYDRAEGEFSEFIANFPNSTNVPRVVLLQANARVKLKKYDQAIELLSRRLSSAGPLADQYRFLLGDANFEKGNFENASALYGELLATLPNSPLRLQASHGQALARFRLKDFAGTVRLLRNPMGHFRQAARASTNQVEIARGLLLLGEAYSEQQNFKEAERAFHEVDAFLLPTELQFRQQYQLATTELADGRAEDALKRTTNLVSLALTNAVQLANVLMFRGRILEAKQPDTAIPVYEEIVRLKGIPSVQTTNAVLRIATLHLDRNRLTNAIQRLVQFVDQSASDASVDLIRLMLGEVYLKQYSSVTNSLERDGNFLIATNSLERARNQFEFIINIQTNSSLLDKAHLNRGWCLWEEGRLTGVPGKYVEAQKSFQAAQELLSAPEDKGLALFKTADCQFQQKDYQSALRNYGLLVSRYEQTPSVKTNLFDQALYQIVQANVAAKDFSAAEQALDKLRAWFPTNQITEQCLIFFGQSLLNEGKAKAQSARDVLADFPRRFPASLLLPQAQLGIARSHVEEANWTAATEQYDLWLSRYTNHSARAQVSWDRAWVLYQAGNETNAMRAFTNFVVQFPNSPLAPLAQNWMADSLYRRNEYYEAEVLYTQLAVSTNAAVGELKYHALLMASKAALHHEPERALSYLQSLLNNRACPPSLLPEAFFIYGDALLLEVNPTNSLARFTNAIPSFRQVLNATNRLAPLARGKIAECYLQLGQLDQAAAEFQNVIGSAGDDVTARSIAKVGLGKVFEEQAKLKQGAEKEALLKQAWNLYLDVLFGKVAPGEKLDPFWIKVAGLRAAQLSSDGLQKPQDAIRVFEQLTNRLPVWNALWQERLATLRQQQALSK